MPDAGPDVVPGSLAERLEHLFQTVHPKDRGPYSNTEVADAIKATDPEISVSDTYLWQLRTSRRDNPTKKHLEAIARFFGVTPLYWYDDEAARRVVDQLEVAVALTDSKVRLVALRAADLSDANVEFVLDMITALGKREKGATAAGDQQPG